MKAWAESLDKDSSSGVSHSNHQITSLFFFSFSIPSQSLIFLSSTSCASSLILPASSLPPCIPPCSGTAVPSSATIGPSAMLPSSTTARSPMPLSSLITLASMVSQSHPPLRGARILQKLMISQFLLKSTVSKAEKVLA